jgi:hypothetical protein
MTTNHTINTIKKGDVITVQREVTVRSIDVSEGVVETTDNRSIRLTQPRYSYISKDLPVFKIVDVKQNNPANWPPKPGEVWEDASGMTYMIIGGPGGAKAYTVTDARFTLDQLKGKLGIKRVYAG